MKNLDDSKFTVLYVDDEPAVLDIGKRFLEKEGDIVIETSKSAITALEKLQYELYDAVVSDYEMPYMNGISFLKAVKKDYNLPFILLTGRGREEVVIEGINHGLDCYIEKDGDPKHIFSDLSNKLKHIIRQKKREEQIRESEETYRTIFDGQPEAIFLLNPDFSINRANRSALGIFPSSGDTIAGTNLLSLLYEEDIHTFSACVSSLTPENPLGFCETRMNESAGYNTPVTKWRYWTIFAVFDPERNLREVQITGRDITSEKVLENTDLTRLLNLIYLQKITMDFVRIEDEEGIYRFVSDQIASLVPDAHVAVCSYDNNTRQLIPLRGLSQEIASRDSDSSFIAQMMENNAGSLTDMVIQRGSLTEIHPGQPGSGLSAPSWSLSPDTLPYKTTWYLIGLVYLGTIYGAIMVTVKEGDVIENQELIESFSSLAAEAIFYKKNRTCVSGNPEQ